MNLEPIFTAISATPVSTYLRESAWGFPIVESAHVIAITLVFGTITIVDLRLLDVTSRRWAVTDVSRDTLKWTWAAFALAVVTGSLLVSSRPQAYFDNIPFRWKMVCLLLAGINMIIFERITFRGVARWDRDTPIPHAGKIAGGLSVLFWIAVVVFGRWIGFTLEH